MAEEEATSNDTMTSLSEISLLATSLANCEELRMGYTLEVWIGARMLVRNLKCC